jgi:hypothetical protein
MMDGIFVILFNRKLAGIEKIVCHIIPFHLSVFNNRATPIAEGAATYCTYCRAQGRKQRHYLVAVSIRPLRNGRCERFRL